MAVATATESSRMGSTARFTGLANGVRKSDLKGAELPLRHDRAVSGGLAATGYMYVHVPTGFVPQEDQNYFIVVVQAPPGASLCLHHGCRQAGGEDLAGRPGHFRHIRGPGFFALAEEVRRTTA